jgi:hypothetical protein
LRIPIDQHTAGHLGAKLGDVLTMNVGGTLVGFVRLRSLEVQAGTEWMHAVLEIQEEE